MKKATVCGGGQEEKPEAIVDEDDLESIQWVKGGPFVPVKIPGTAEPLKLDALMPADKDEPSPRVEATRDLTTDEVTERLKEAVEGGLSGSALVELRVELAEASGLHASDIHRLHQAIEQETDAADAMQQEVAAIRAEADRRDLGSVLTLDHFLPPSLAEALRVRCLALPVDAVAAVTAFLTTVSGLVKLGSAVVASRAADYRVPPNLYSALVAVSGAKKSPVSKLLVELPTKELQADLAREHGRCLAAWHQEIKGMKPADRPPKPKAAYIETNDFSAEALADQLQVQEARGLGLLIRRDELSGLFGSLNQYRSGRGSDEQQLLEAYDGSGFKSLRISADDGGRFYERCHLSIWGTIQPAVLEELVGEGDSNGLWARFLFVPLPRLVVPLADNESDTEQQAAAEAARILADACSAIYRQSPGELYLSTEARTAFNRYEERCQTDALNARLGAQSALYGKAAGKVLRVAGLLHLLHQVAADGEHSEVITAATMARATSLVDHLNGWALSFHADIANGGAHQLMQLVHRLALEAAPEPIRWKEVASKLSHKSRNLHNAASATAAMEALAALEVGVITRGAKGAVTYRALGPLP